MKKHILAVVALVAAAVSPAWAEGTETLAPKLQNLSVTVHSESGQGSGTVITRKGINFVLTAGHVVAGNRKVTKVVTDSGDTKTEISFQPVTVVKEIYSEGRSVGSTTVEGAVVAYSSSEYGDDLALLKLRSKVTDDSTDFYAGELVQVGTPLVHVGSLLGQEGSNSFTTGEMSQIGRVLFDKVFDQVSCPAYPGSSGGGVFLRDSGAYVGTLVRGAEGSTFNLIVPVRRIKKWADEHKCAFLFDPKATSVDGVKLETREPIGGSPVVNTPEGNDSVIIKRDSSKDDERFPILLAP